MAWMLALYALLNRVQLGRGLCRTDVGFEPADRLPTVVAENLTHRAVQGPRHPQVSRLIYDAAKHHARHAWETEFRRHDADDGQWLSVERDAFPDNFRVSIKPTLPERMAENCNLIPSSRLFFLYKIASDERRHSECLK